jgi:hypothetical protein
MRVLVDWDWYGTAVLAGWCCDGIEGPSGWKVMADGPCRPFGSITQRRPTPLNVTRQMAFQTENAASAEYDR